MSFGAIERSPGVSDADPGPTRPDRITIWPVEDGRFGIDVAYHGERGYRRADQVHRFLNEAGLTTEFRNELDGAWAVRFGPVGRDEMLTALNGVVW